MAAVHPKAVTGDLVAFYNINGNETVENAEVIIITDVHDHLEIRQKNIKLIQQIWRDHTLLVETIPEGQEIALDSHETTRGLRISKKAKGWDAPFTQFFVDGINKRNTEFHSIVKNFQKQIQDPRNWGKMLKPKGLLDAFFNFAPEKDQKSKESFHKLFRADRINILLNLINPLIIKINEHHQERVRQFKLKTFQFRQDFLIDALAKATLRGTGGKAIAILGAAHAFRIPAMPEPEYSTDSISCFLKTRKYVIISPKMAAIDHNKPKLWAKSSLPLSPAAPPFPLHPETSMRKVELIENKEKLHKPQILEMD